VNPPFTVLTDAARDGEEECVSLGGDARFHNSMMFSLIWLAVSGVPLSAGTFIAGFPSPLAPWQEAHFDL